MFSTVRDIIRTLKGVQYRGDTINTMEGYHPVLGRIFSTVEGNPGTVGVIPMMLMVSLLHSTEHPPQY